MKITKTTIPATSLLNQTGWAYDYTDSFQSRVTDNENKLKIAHVGKAFFLSAPKWIKSLFALRNSIVGVLGLKTHSNINQRQILNEFQYEQGSRIGLFKIFESNSKEIILGANDIHLNFRVSLFLEKCKENENQKQLTISTTVVFKNLFGKLYFFLVKPLHKIIAPAMLRSIIRSGHSSDKISD